LWVDNTAIQPWRVTVPPFIPQAVLLDVFQAQQLAEIGTAEAVLAAGPVHIAAAVLVNAIVHVLE
jgi:hypothetical protein